MSKDINREVKYPPGDFGVWIIIYVELLTFGLFFIGYAFSRRSNLEMFNTSQLMLNQTSGFINTIILVTSSYFVAKGVQLMRNMTQETIASSNKKASVWLTFAIICGVAFLFVKGSEFANIFGQGINLSTNKFFMFYLLLTMFHFMHVVLGTVILFNIRQRTKISAYTPDNHRGFESGASYWHMVDLLWIVLFPLIYIIR
ncbi:MAG: cytochrome c oxidase subunit 3 family protein [Epsilonproteobacteria bacterium]|nr:cytochrome c oxidase subunit 3 family protein [Campylobacterota bacterium]